MKWIVAERFDPRFDPRYQPGFTPRPDATGPDATVPDATANDTTVPDTTVPAGVESVEVVLELNPFERTLWMVAVVLVIGGIAAALWANSFNYTHAGNEWGWQEMLRSSAWALTTPMITVGLATGVGLLFRRAITWKPVQ